MRRFAIAGVVLAFMAVSATAPNYSNRNAQRPSSWDASERLADAIESLKENEAGIIRRDEMVSIRHSYIRDDDGNP